MSPIQFEIQWVAALTAAACALPGVFLVLQRKAMLADAISHTVLLGIVVGFFIVQDLSSPYLVLGAAAVGVITVSFTALLERTQLVRSDAAIGLVFPALFSAAVLLISLYAGNVHLDTDAVLSGEVAYAPFERFTLAGLDFGPRGAWVMGGVTVINLAFILLFYKELKITTFDAGLAAALGFAPALLHYLLMTLVSVTVVSAFDVVGSVLVVALMIAPPAAAYLLTERLDRMIALSVGGGVVSALSGYWLARALDASIAGAIAVMAGVWFLLAFLFAPKRGWVAAARQRAAQRLDFSVVMLAAHLLNHEGSPAQAEESRVEHLGEHLRWSPAFARQVVQAAQHRGLVRQVPVGLELTQAGRQLADERFRMIGS